MFTDKRMFTSDYLQNLIQSRSLVHKSLDTNFSIKGSKIFSMHETLNLGYFTLKKFWIKNTLTETLNDVKEHIRHIVYYIQSVHA